MGRKSEGAAADDRGSAPFNSLGELLQWKELFKSGQPREVFEGPLNRLFDGTDLVLESFGDETDAA